MVREAIDFYDHSVYLFVERVKDMIVAGGEELVRIGLIPLRGTALIWYTGELNELARLALLQIHGEWRQRKCGRYLHGAHLYHTDPLPRELHPRRFLS